MTKQNAECPAWMAKLPGRLTNHEVEQLKQLLTVTWDGQLVSKQMRDNLVEYGLVARTNGWNYLTTYGVEALLDANVLKP